MSTASRPALALALVPGALTVGLAFSGGGYFPVAIGVLAFVLAAALALQTLGARDPFAGVGPALAFVAGALALLAIWTLASSGWSHAPARALTETDRVLVYLLALLVFGFLGRSVERQRWIARGMALAATGVCATGLVSRILPELLPTARNLAPQRLSYPISYWNALGLLAAIGCILCVHFAASEREPAGVRVAAAAALPVLATTLLFTFSRGGMAVGIVGVIAYALLARTRGLLTAGAAAGPPVALALLVAYRADRLASPDLTSPAAVAQGRDVAVAVAVAVLAAALLAAALIAVERRVPVRPLRRPRRAAAVALSVAALGLVGGASMALAVPHSVSQGVRDFVDQRSVPLQADSRARLTDPSNNGRLDHWRVSLDGFSAHPLHGTGAGTYALEWQRLRPAEITVVDGHSLYLETLGELGIVGLVLLLAAVGTILVALARRIGGRDRGLHAAVFAAALAWAIHAGIDWDWEMPVVTLWVFAAGGAALARPVGLVGAARRRAATRVTRVAAAGGFAVLALAPAAMAASQARLNAATRALDQGDCVSAERDAVRSHDAVGARPEPFEVIALCELRAGRPGPAAQAARAAIARDPANWRLHYELALALAVARRPALREARRAHRLDPLEPLAVIAVARLRDAHGVTDRQQAARRLAHIP